MKGERSTIIPLSLASVVLICYNIYAFSRLEPLEDNRADGDGAIAANAFVPQEPQTQHEPADDAVLGRPAVSATPREPTDTSRNARHDNSPNTENTPNSKATTLADLLAPPPSALEAYGAPDQSASQTAASQHINFDKTEASHVPDFQATVGPTAAGNRSLTEPLAQTEVATATEEITSTELSDPEVAQPIMMRQDTPETPSASIQSEAISANAALRRSIRPQPRPAIVIAKSALASADAPPTVAPPEQEHSTTMGQIISAAPIVSLRPLARPKDIATEATLPTVSAPVPTSGKSIGEQPAAMPSLINKMIDEAMTIEVEQKPPNPAPSVGTITGIFETPEGRWALVATRRGEITVLREGDRTANGVVSAIEDGSIRLRSDGLDAVLTVGDQL